MNRQFLRRMSALIAAAALFASVNAQMSKSMLESNPKELIYSDSAVDPATRNKDNLNSIKISAIKDFNKNFKTAQNVSWFVIKDGFSVKFNENGVTVKSYYDFKGHWVGVVRSYGQDKLPADIRKQVRSTYYDYSIYVVNEVTVGDKKAYLVGIQDDENIKTIRIIDGEMDVYEDFKKDHI
jgi:hypothetical protein